MLKPLIDECEAAWRASLETIGFTQVAITIDGRRYKDIVMDVNDEVFGSIGLNRVAYRKSRRVEVNVVVGASHVPLELKVAEIRGQDPRQRYAVPATISKHLGYLTPEDRYTPWWFSEDQDVEALAHDMAAWIEVYAFPFYGAHQTLKDFYESLRDRRYRGITQYDAYRVPVAALMLGMPKAAQRHMAEYLTKLEENGKGHPAQRVPIPREAGIAFIRGRPTTTRAVDEYREFCQRLLRLIVEGHVESEEASR